MSIASMLVNTVAVERVTSALDSSGGPVLSFTTPSGLEELSCSIQPATGKAKLLYAQHKLTVTHRVYFDADHGLRRGDRLKLSSTRYLIIHGGGDMPGRGRLWFFDCEEQN